ncbi:unnamed protein product [Amoebophrya sp. A120]|nr:unnamed protein product [Amoebophrya sp. A120]|eukprot:GSA120T00024537001.1
MESGRIYVDITTIIFPVFMGWSAALSLLFPAFYKKYFCCTMRKRKGDSASDSLYTTSSSGIIKASSKQQNKTGTRTKKSDNERSELNKVAGPCSTTSPHQADAAVEPAAATSAEPVVEPNAVEETGAPFPHGAAVNTTASSSSSCCSTPTSSRGGSSGRNTIFTSSPTSASKLLLEEKTDIMQQNKVNNTSDNASKTKQDASFSSKQGGSASRLEHTTTSWFNIISSVNLKKFLTDYCDSIKVPIDLPPLPITAQLPAITVWVLFSIAAEDALYIGVSIPIAVAGVVNLMIYPLVYDRDRYYHQFLAQLVVAVLIIFACIFFLGVEDAGLCATWASVLGVPYYTSALFGMATAIREGKPEALGSLTMNFAAVCAAASWMLQGLLVANVIELFIGCLCYTIINACALVLNFCLRSGPVIQTILSSGSETENMENNKTAGGLQEQEKRSSDASSTSNEDRNKDLDKAKEVEFTSTTSSSRDHYFNKVESSSSSSPTKEGTEIMLLRNASTTSNTSTAFFEDRPSNTSTLASSGSGGSTTTFHGAGGGPLSNTNSALMVTTPTTAGAAGQEGISTASTAYAALASQVSKKQHPPSRPSLEDVSKALEQVARPSL